MIIDEKDLAIYSIFIAPSLLLPPSDIHWKIKDKTLLKS